MRKINWSGVEKSGKKLKSRIKNIQAAGNYLESRPGAGYYFDNISKKEVLLVEAKASTLRRFLKQVQTFYYLITSESDKEYLLNKRIEIESELSTRDDGVLESKR